MEALRNECEQMIHALKELMMSENVRYEQRFSSIDKTLESEVKTQKTAMETALVAQKTAMETAFIAAEKVSAKTEHATEERFKSIDKINEQIRQQAMTFIPRQEWQITVDNISASVKKLEEYQAKSIGAETYGTKNKSQIGLIIGLIISAMAIIITVIMK